jgi:hypothetical protein
LLYLFGIFARDDVNVGKKREVQGAALKSRHFLATEL